MNNKKIICFVLIMNMIPINHIQASTQCNNSDFTLTETQVLTQNIEISPFASKIIVDSSWQLISTGCLFSMTFIRESTGSGYATLEKKNGSSWDVCGEINFGFNGSRTLDCGITTSTRLNSGTYRLVINLNANGYSEEKIMDSKTY